MAGVYSHVPQGMRNDLTAALTRRWENALRERAAIDPHSPVPALDATLARFRPRESKIVSQKSPKNASGVSREGVQAV